MWLDRLGPNAPPSGFDSRPMSPVPPRRQPSARGPSSPYITSSSSQQRSSARASTTSLVSSSDSGSTTSLLRGSSSRGAAGAAGGSSLRQSHTVDDGSESLAVLGQILGDDRVAAQGANGPVGEKRSVTITEEDLEADYDFGGLSLREFVARGEAGEAARETYRPQTVDECMWTFFFLFPSLSCSSICAHIRY